MTNKGRQDIEKESEKKELGKIQKDKIFHGKINVISEQKKTIRRKIQQLK